MRGTLSAGAAWALVGMALLCVAGPATPRRCLATSAAQTRETRLSFLLSLPCHVNSEHVCDLATGIPEPGCRRARVAPPAPQRSLPQGLYLAMARRAQSIGSRKESYREVIRTSGRARDVRAALSEALADEAALDSDPALLIAMMSACRSTGEWRRALSLLRRLRYHARPFHPPP